MKSNRRNKVTVISLLAALILALLAAVSLIVGAPLRAEAGTTDRYVQLDGSQVFYRDNIRGAEITYNKQTEGEKDRYYAMFKIGDKQTVSYRQNLAYSWKEGVYEESTTTDEDGKTDTSTYYTGESKVARFNMELGFASTDFEKYIIRFQSQQYIYADGYITENYLVFSKSEGKIYLSVVEKLEDEDPDKVELGELTATDKISVAFGEFDSGKYPIIVKVNGVKYSEVQSFKNVYEAYSSYISSGDTAVTPIRFSAEFSEAQAAAGATAQMILYSVNGQSFEVYDHGSTGNYDYVKDTAAPVMCFTATPSYLEYGKAVEFSYKTIDVLASSPRSTAYYYVLSGEQFEAPDYDYDKLYDDWKSSTPEEGENSSVLKNPYVTISSSSSIRIVRDDNTFIPSEYLDTDGEYRVYGLVKIYYEISDVSPTSTTANKETVYIDWYAKPEALVNVYDIKGVSGKTSNFLRLIDGKDGVSYAKATDTTEAAYKATVAQFQADYQAKIDEKIAGLKDKEGNVVGKLYAGSDSKFYLPAVEYDFADSYNVSGDYKYSIYYMTDSGTKSSSKSLAYNKLALNLTESNVRYYFKLYVTDAFSNDMLYPVTNAQGEVEWKKITEDDVWSDDAAGLLPEFSFYVDYKKATSENPEDLSLAYVGTSYSGVSFKINGVSGTYSATYKLYLFDRNAMYRDDPANTPDYDELTDKYKELFSNPDTRKYFTTVKPSSELVAGDYNYDLYKDINWNATAISFMPLSIDDIYVVELELSDKDSGDVSYYYAYVSPSTQATSVAGENNWVENNLVSIILLSVAGVCLIGLLVLLLVRPKDKGDIDAVYSEEEEKRQAKKAKKANK